jgi:hypothetical protein
MKGRARKSYTIEDYYESYIEYVSDSEIYKIEKKVFREILEDYFSFLANEVICKSKEVRLPARMGTLKVVKKKPKRYDFTYCRIDFNETRKMGKTILHLNEHSSGYNYKFHWEKKDILISNITMYELIMSRHNKRLLAKKIKSRDVDYIEA